MKILLSIVVFALTLSLAHRSLATGHEAEAKGHKSEAEETSEKMNALFPKKQADPAKSVLPAKTELTEPAYFAKISGDKATLKWKAVEGADQYHLQVATDPNFKWLKVNEEMMTGTSYDVAQLEPGIHYFWRVQAIKSENEQTFRKSQFATSMFETAGAPAEKK